MALQLKISPWKNPGECQTPQKHTSLTIILCKIQLQIQSSLPPSSKAKTHLPETPILHPILTALSPQSSRRSLNLSIFALILSSWTPSNANAIAEKETEFERYTDSKEGFTLLIPPSYIKVEKAGATALFEEENKGANNVGIVVNPVKLTSLTDFGTPQFVADKLIQAEKRKESTKDAEVIGVTQRPGLKGLPIYEFEYIVDSTRGGMKRIFSAAFVSEKKLYLLNISHVDKPDNPLDNHTRMMLEQVLHSFDAAPLT